MTARARTCPGSWMVALAAVDGKLYVDRVYAPDDALPRGCVLGGLPLP